MAWKASELKRADSLRKGIKVPTPEVLVLDEADLHPSARGIIWDLRAHWKAMQYGKDDPSLIVPLCNINAHWTLLLITRPFALLPVSNNHLSPTYRRFTTWSSVSITQPNHRSTPASLLTGRYHTSSTTSATKTLKAICSQDSLNVAMQKAQPLSRQQRWGKIQLLRRIKTPPRFEGESWIVVTPEARL